ncbi:hypothetical protein GCM10023063_28450 [Arthrobacter methylotrophus]|uniref:hypothetical protein n=1 Tax=Arthrobacter methylotrophus TaxID=121291 RepID=UPI0031F0E2C6
MLANPVFRIDLADYPADRSTYDFTELDRQMRWALQTLPAGANVRLIVHKYKPSGELGWMRADLIVQVEATDPTVIAEWMLALSPDAAAA